VKGFLLFCAFLSGIIVLGVALPHLDDRDRIYEERLVGALRSAEVSLGAALGTSADIYEAAIAPGSTPGDWTLSGRVVSRRELNGKTGVPFVANLRSQCSNPADSGCWETVELAIDGRVVRLASTAEAVGETAREGIAEEAGGSGEIGDRPTVPAAAQFADKAAVVPSSSAEKVFSAPAEGPIEAVASVKSEPTPDVSGEVAVSGPDLVLLIQDGLKKLGYEPGPADGKLGARTAAAIRDYQRNFDLPQDGRPSPGLLLHMRGQLGALGQQSRGPAGTGSPAAG
jgi:hypothetical protein